VGQPGHEIAVQLSALLAHAARVEGIAGEIGTARAAGDAVRSGAYGQLCQVVPVLLHQLQNVLLDGIGAAQESLDDTADRLRTAAQGYRGTDQQREQVNRRLRGAL
jgi:uncharacterized protein YukE